MLRSLQSALHCCGRYHSSRKTPWLFTLPSLLLAASALGYSALVPALGLGEITLRSALTQPLDAEIALLEPGELSEGEMSVSLATAEEFGRAGVERVFFLNDLRFTPILQGNRSVIRVVSNKPVTEPFLNFLVQVNQPGGRSLREYTVLIDPPGSPGIEPRSKPASNLAPVSPANPQSSAQAPRKAATAVPAKPDDAQAIALAAAQQQALTAEQLASSVLENQHLQATVAEQQARLATQDEEIVAGKKVIVDLQTRLAEVQAPPASAAAPVAPAPVNMPPVAESDETGGSNFWLMAGLVLLLLLLIVAFWVRRQRSHTQTLPEPLPLPPVAPEPVVSRVEPQEAQAADDQTGQRVAPRKAPTQASDVLEGVRLYLAYGRLDEAVGILREALLKEPERLDLGLRLLEVLGQQGAVAAYAEQESRLRESGVDEEALQDIRQRFAKLSSASGGAPQVLAASVAAVPVSAALDEFQLNLDDLSIDSDWNLVSPFDATPSVRPTSVTHTTPDFDPLFNSNLNELPEVFEMSDEPFLSDFSEPEPASTSETDALDEAFLDSFASTPLALEIEPLSVDFDTLELEQDGAGKLQQAQGCIDDGDLDSASRLLIELLEEGDEPQRRTARNLLARMG
ncbi:FimV/HubP family polar landmark protein [Pseudomonas fluorescens]|uniref:FimV N-terminal domain-containing protein n=1 Tax=Pseudomonas fluorescens TaxID=294 RepID=A0A5E7F2G3_PSEFL|nr:FimV/HubP family polar landmark protein [Pseudomonas fluorescens]VVO31853.1 hypothetical protein PS691_05007 [Pseudomonas fluorescens]